MRNHLKTVILPPAALSIIFFASPVAKISCLAQQPQQPYPQQPAPVDDAIRELGLTPDQENRIRAIREETKQERAAINQRLREANRVLEVALDADAPDEAVVEQRLRDVANAQAAQMRMRVLTELRILRVLSPEQRLRWRELRQQAARRRQSNDRKGNQRALDRTRTFPSQRDGLGPAPPPASDRRLRP